MLGEDAAEKKLAELVCYLSTTNQRVKLLIYTFRYSMNKAKKLIRRLLIFLQKYLVDPGLLLEHGDLLSGSSIL